MKGTSSPTEGAAAAIAGLRVFEGSPRDFWPAYLEALIALAGARAGVVLIPSEQDWRPIFQSPRNSRVLPEGTEPAALCEAALTRGTHATALDGETILAVRLETAEQPAVALLAARSDAALESLALAADTPASYARSQSLARSQREVTRFASALDFSLRITAQDRWMAAAMLFCNELVERFACDRVTLGWLEGSYVRMQAISHSEKFERKMEVVQRMEASMEECLEQDDEIVWPAPSDSPRITRDHEAFARAESPGHLLSLPFREKEEPRGVVLLERKARAFTEAEVETLRLVCDQTATRLADLKKRDRWFGARWAASGCERAAKLVGVEHTGWKLLGLLVAILLGVLIFGRGEHRVKAPFILKSQALAQLPAPFEGYIESVHYRIGDQVVKGQPLLALDTRELRLQEAAAIAERSRHLGEAQQAESAGALAQMRIARAEGDRAEAQLALALHRLGQAEVRAPFDGFVVEGDLRERIASPVKQGEVLIKVAQLDHMYAEMKVPEREIVNLREGSGGTLAFASRPKDKFPLIVERIEPVAETTEEGNVFIVRCALPAEAAVWWRPGMSGIARIDAGRRSLLWIYTHRTADFIRLKLWW